MYAGKDTYAAGRLVQKWRKPSNPISQGKLLSKDLAPNAFHIGIDDVNKSVNEVVKLIKEDKHFAVLMPISVTSEIARLENVDGERCHDLDLAKKVSAMSKITLASSAEVWLINLPGDPFNHFYSNDMEGLGLTGVQDVFLASYEDMKTQSRIILEELDPTDDTRVTMESFPVTRSAKRARNQLHVAQEPNVISAMARSPDQMAVNSIHTPAGETIVTGDRLTEEHGMSSVAPLHENGTIRWTNTTIR